MLIRRVIVPLVLFVVAALLGAPAGHADGAVPVHGECEFLGTSPLSLAEGERPRARITFLNDSQESGWFTATVEAGFHYWHARPFYRQLLSAETGLVQGEFDLPPAYAEGLGDASGLRIDITSTLSGDTTIGTCSTKLKVHTGRDTDQDGLLDDWEINGIDYDQDGTVDLALNQPPYSADPNKKDIFVELDAMFCLASYCRRSREFDPNAISQVVTAFAAHGITLHVYTGERAGEAERITFDTKSPGSWDDFDDVKFGDPAIACDGNFGDVLDRISRNCENILGAKRLAFRYAVSVHGLTGLGTTSGQAEAGDDTQQHVDLAHLARVALPGGNDFVISLGAWDNTRITANGGQTAAEAGTFMHELGHTLGLQHGGLDSVNCKPNYLSVMNYSYQFPTASTASRPLDYQPQERASMNEDQGLDEVGDALPGAGSATVVYGTVVAGKPGVALTTPANKPVDWNGDGTSATSQSGDVNHIIMGPDTRSCPVSPKQTLTSWNDWDHLNLNFRESPWFEDGAHKGVLGLGSAEITAEAAASLNPPIDLTAAKTVDRQDASPGDRLTYTVAVDNKGPATATAVKIDDTMPGGDVVHRTTSDVPAGGSARETFTYDIPCATTDGTVLTNKAAVSGTNERGYAETGTLSDNTAGVSTTVHRPVIGVAATAPATVNAGEAAAYTLTYRNTGGAAASGATLTATLPAGLSYSAALDQGAGPRPGSVSRNTDGTTTLRWAIGTLPAGTGTGTIAFTARPSLLLLDAATVTVPVSLSADGSGPCPTSPAAATAETRITTVSPSRDPGLVTFWALRADLRTAEALARVQATDDRFDGADGSAANGALSLRESTAVLTLPLTQPRTLRAELLATTLNLAGRRINAGTAVDGLTARALGVRTVGEAVRHAQATLAQPPTLDNLVRYTKATQVLAEINSGLAI
ncbi:hypothetical protein OIE67_21435 [Nonomuraea fuscirosea]|uniref:DUF7507 domain-containing protein n=1 Tax=Nonomuraea fuscirosea TaxID=1291556 RepID=UPI002DD80DF3|nr:hypothetical protein [Nonomuraea fuscirosea]WSA57078.1 hypothetical protein OIE67_21435 [Nonomuraea fuscirosea]